jgi:tRNA modification GTPase
MPSFKQVNTDTMWRLPLMNLCAGGQGSTVSIVRVSGDNAKGIAAAVFRAGHLRPKTPRRDRTFVPETHRIYYGYVVDGRGTVMDEVLLLAMLGPRSYTKEDVIELHCHGGVISGRRVLDACIAAGCRLATRGEFTLRAFLNGRLDLSQAESVMQLVGAKTVSAADSALAGLMVCAFL